MVAKRARRGKNTQGYPVKVVKSAQERVQNFVKGKAPPFLPDRFF